MTDYELNEIKVHGIGFIQKLAAAGNDEHEIGCAALWVTDFIRYLEDQVKEAEK